MPTARTPSKRRAAPSAAAGSSEANDSFVAAARPAGTSPDPSRRVEALRTVLFDTIEKQVQDGNVRVILWLADRLRLVEAREERQGPADELRALLDDLPPDDLREFVSLGARQA
jgi:hypothetical protein